MIFLLVLGLRFGLPLAIPYFPLPAVLACLVLDGMDQSIFQKFTDLDLTNYQGYDKALDIYYLTIAYLSTLRNWTNNDAFNASRFLLYYRLVGVLLFEFTHVRALLVIFPNTFEYFFIFYEAVRLRWDPIRMGRRLVIGAVAAIWIVIKLPQEYWIHVAQLDFTDEMAERPNSWPILITLVAILLIAAWWIVTRRLPPADRRPELRVPDPFADPAIRAAMTTLPPRRVFDSSLFEKVAMISLVSVIFSQILPDMEATGVQVALGVTLLIFANTVVSEWLVRRGTGWTTMLQQFVAMAVVNTGLVVLSSLVLRRADGSIHLGNTLFFLLLITLLVTLYDRFRPIYLARRAAVAGAPVGATSAAQ
ncbi:MAG TPA: hypothetical protein VM450_18450 [Thermomicrobiales bacterium]|nr:hypothetical protein [Thermomicrobiales bacterium]